jgi:hypothetical protein
MIGPGVPRSAAARRPISVALALITAISVAPSALANEDAPPTAVGVMRFTSRGSASGLLTIPQPTSLALSWRDEGHMTSPGRWAAWLIRRVGTGPAWWDRGAALLRVTHFDHGRCDRANCVLFELDTYLSRGPENEGHEPILTETFYLNQGIYEVLLIGDGDVEVAAQAEFAGLPGSATMELTRPAWGVTTTSMPWSVRSTRTKLKQHGPPDRHEIEGGVQGAPDSSGVSTFWLWATKTNAFKHDLRACMAPANSTAFDAAGRCTHEGARLETRNRGEGVLYGGTSYPWFVCQPQHHWFPCEPGEMRMAFRGVYDALEAPRVGGFAMFIAWPP